MKLFDEMERDDVGPAGYAGSRSEYLNRSARPEFAAIRDVLEEWFSHYPDDLKPWLRSRLRDQEGDDHIPAFFELLLHELLLRLGCRVDVLDDPGRAEARRPDFLAESPGHGSFYLEATVVTEKSKQDRAEEAITNDLYDQLNRLLDSPNFFLSITVYGVPATAPPARKIAAHLSRELEGLDPDEVSRVYQSEGWESLPTQRYPHEGCLIVFQAMPRRPEARGIPGLRPVGITGPSEATLVESAERIRDKVEKKAQAYGRLDHPYVLAVNALGDYAGYDDFRAALYGVPEAGSDAAFSPTRQRVSAVLATVGMRPSHVTRAPLVLYHNPWARLPYECVLNQLPQVTVGPEGPERTDGDSLAALFGLPAEWPEQQEAEAES